MASRLDPDDFGYQNFYETTLTGDIAAGTLTIPLATVPTPTSGILVIDPDSETNREVILYTSKGASDVVCPADGRGYDGTTGVSHLQGTTVIMAPIKKWFTALASGELSTDPLRTELFGDFVASGCVWSADSAGSNRNGSMTSGVIYIAGRRLTVGAVTAHTFTASKDTYVDAFDAGDGTATLRYTEVSNNAASPALTTGDIRLAIITTAAGSIAAAGNVNQGQPTAASPTISNAIQIICDSLGNPISPHPRQTIIAGRRKEANFTTTNTSATQITGLSITFPATGRLYKARFVNRTVYSDGAGTIQSVYLTFWNGTVGSGTRLREAQVYMNAGGETAAGEFEIPFYASGSTTINCGLHSGSGSFTATMDGNATYPVFFYIEEA